MLTPAPLSMDAPAPAVINEVVALIRRGRPLSALALLPGLKENAPHWMDAKTLTNAARVAERTGGGLISQQWHRLNFRRHPEDDYCFLYRCFDMAGNLGAPRVLRMIEQRLKNPAMQVKHRADILTVAVNLLSVMRDFERAGRLMDEALSLRPREPWIMACKASLLRQMDRREEALALCGEVLSVMPESGRGMEIAAQLLIELNREREAEELLLRGCETTEISDLRWQLYSYYSERERPDEALHWLDEYIRHSPLLPEKALNSLRGNRSTLLLLRGDLAAAREEALACGSPYYAKMAAAMTVTGATEAARVRLPVGFVRQHHMTCGPATLSALASYWGHAAPHLEIAEKICYDGTSHYSERTWAQEQGLDGREFRVTPEVTRALLNRGVPFTLVTAWATGAHLQSVIGTDDRAGLLIIRDPTHSHYSEALLEGFLKDCEPHGPRGMLVLPDDQKSRTEGIALPEAELYDMVHAVEAGLQKHNRGAAQQWFEQLQAQAPGHRMTWYAQLSLAAYDDNPVKSHEALQALAALYPEDSATAWRAFRSNRERSTRTETLAELERRARDPKSDSVFLSELARMLAEDDRTARRAAKILHRLLRRNPADAQALTTLARCQWSARAFDDALELYRLAACAADKNEICASSYFQACRQMNRADEALRFLRRRVEEFGRLAAAPHLTLADALCDLVRGAEAMKVVQTARSLRPGDGDLLLYEARLHVTQGRFAEAGKLLDLAQTKVPVQQWHRQSAALAQARGNPEDCAAHWRSVLGTEPLALDAHIQLARLTAQMEGMDRTLELLAQTVARWPWHQGVARLYVDWLRRAGRPEAETELRRILQQNPADDWAWRELALELSDRLRHGEAMAAAGESLRLAPSLSTSWAIHGAVLEKSGQRAEAHEALRSALGLDITCGMMHSLIQTAADAAQRRDAILFLRNELSRQNTGGEAVTQFREVAQPILSSDEMTAILREGHQARPDLFETWCAYAEHLITTQPFEAMNVAKDMSERFPWAPGSWRLYSHACGEMGLKAERLSALQHAVEISPQWSLAVRELSELHEREGRMEEALHEIQRIVRANPLEPANHGVLADMLLRQGRTEEALTALERAVEVGPGYDWGWGELCRQCKRAGTPERAITAARRLTSSRPDEPRSWIVLVEVHGRLEQWPEALKNATQALGRWPKNVRLNELHAIIHNAEGRRKEALDACSPPVFDGQPPRELKARHAAFLLDAAEYSEAERQLEAIIAAEPDYAWPRSLLYDLCRARGDNERCLDLCRDLVRIDPENAVSAGMLAESLTKAGKHAEAMAAVRRALELDPRYTYAAARLFDSEMEHGRHAAAADLLGLMERFQQGPRNWLCRARLDLAQNRTEDALRSALLLIQSDDENADAAFNILMDHWQKLPKAQRDRMDQVLTAAVREGRAKNPGISTRYAALHKSPRVSAGIHAAIALPVPGPVRDNIVRDLLYAAAEDKQHDDALKAVKEHRDLLRSTTGLWGAVSYVLLLAGKRSELVEWGNDWISRSDREPWMTANMGIALAWEKGPMAAVPAWEEVLRAGPSNVWAQAAAGLAFTCAINGRTDEARRHLDNLQNQELNAEDKHSAAMARTALAASHAGPGSNPINARRAADLHRQVLSAWQGGTQTVRGKHYRRELENFLHRHQLDAAFARFPSDRAPRYATGSSSGGGSSLPSWSYYVIGAILIAMVRACTSQTSTDRRYQPPRQLEMPREDRRPRFPKSLEGSPKPQPRAPGEDGSLPGSLFDPIPPRKEPKPGIKLEY